MRIQLTLVLLTAIVAILGARLAQCAQQALAITVSESHDGISAGTGIEKAGSPVTVLVTLTNHSKRTVSSSLIDYDEYCTIDVRDVQGNSVPETEYLRKLRAPGRRKSGHGLTSQYKPGETWQEKVPITDYFDVSRPGKYKIRLERQLPEEPGKGSVKSNLLTVTVAE